MDRLELSPNNQFNGMAREDFKQFLIAMGFDVEEIKGPGYVSYEKEIEVTILDSVLNSCNSFSRYSSTFTSFVYENESFFPACAENLAA